MLIKFLIIPINGKKTSLQYSKSGFDEETYDFVEISNKLYTGNLLHYLIVEKS